MTSHKRIEEALRSSGDWTGGPLPAYVFFQALGAVEIQSQTHGCSSAHASIASSELNWHSLHTGCTALQPRGQPRSIHAGGLAKHPNKSLIQQASIGENMDCKDVAWLQLLGMSGILRLGSPSRDL